MGRSGKVSAMATEVHQMNGMLNLIRSPLADLTRAQLLDRIKRGRGPRVIKLGHETWRFTRGDVIDWLGGCTFEPGARRRA